VTIPAQSIVVVDKDTPLLGDISIQGTLIFDDSADITLSATSITVDIGGTLAVGNSLRPHMNTATIILSDTQNSNGTVIHSDKSLVVHSGGALQLFGASRTPAWTVLQKTAYANSTLLVMNEATNWQPGDNIVISSTSQNMSQTERVTILFVAGNVINITTPLQFTHNGELVFVNGTVIDMRARVSVLSRNIVIRGDDNSNDWQYGASIYLHTGATAIMHDVEVYYAGQMGAVNRPALLFRAGNSSSLVESCAIHDTYHRGIVLQGTSNLTIHHTTVAFTMGHAFVLQYGTEAGNTFSNNLAISVNASSFIEASDVTPAGFYISNPANEFVGNSVAGSLSFGFWYRLAPITSQVSAQLLCASVCFKFLDSLLCLYVMIEYCIGTIQR